jgi:hypothetical protein
MHGPCPSETDLVRQNTRPVMPSWSSTPSSRRWPHRVYATPPPTS